MLLRTSAVDSKVRQTLVQSLYAQPGSLAIGALVGVVASLVAAHEARIPAISFTAFLLAVVAGVRVALAFLLPRWHAQDRRTLVIVFEVCSLGYAFLAGLIAALCVHYDVAQSVQMLLVGNAIGYGVGISSRNAGRPVIAIGQLCLALLPVIFAVGVRDELSYQIMAFSLVMMLPAMIAITLSVYRLLRHSVEQAETSARLARRMQDLARTDVVTGLLNRAGLNHHLAQRVMAAADAPDGKLALFWIDLDRFKEVNDTLGHQTGDRLLAEVAQRLRRQAPDGATISRFAGDEFIVACEAADRPAVETLAMRIFDDLCRPARIEENRLDVGCSMGIAILPDDGEDMEALLQGADLALYHSKVNGRGRVSFFDPAMTSNLVRRREIEAELRQAIQRDELSIFFQPIIDLKTGRIRSFEALVRWFHPSKGELSPDEFIPVAEESGAIITLGNWITAQAARTAAQWPEDVTLAVNLSPLQIKAPGAALGILAALREARLDPRRLELEITETVLLDHSQATANFINELTAAGVRFALDDFGTGYSSLGYLDKYPFGKIKVDRSFVSGVNAGRTSEAIIRAVSGMGRTLGMEIVAEGLETVDQVRAVSEAGCTLGQGWYFSRAVPDYLATMLLARERDRLNPRRVTG